MERVLDRILQFSAALVHKGVSRVEKGFTHRPVLVKETLHNLAVRPGGVYIDCTAGEGGHAAAILEAAMPSGRLLGMDLDPQALERARQRLSRFEGSHDLARASYSRADELAGLLGYSRPDGILMDLGISSLQLESPGRGFSIMRDEPLDMRFDPGASITAADVVNGYPAEELAGVIFQYGEEPRSRAISRAIVQSRPLATTGELAELVARVKGRRRGRVHPATRTFQALRIEVNGELDNLRAGLAAIMSMVKPGGRLVVISYHSLEDRLVKQTFAREARKCVCPAGTPVCICGHEPTFRTITRKVITPSEGELAANPRSRSARMRATERLSEADSGTTV